MGLNAVAPSPTLTVGGQVFTDLDNLISLVGSTASGTLYTGFRKNTETSGYQVPVGKILVIKAMRIQNKSTSTTFFSLNYADNDQGMGSATAPTNPVYLGGATQCCPAGGTSVNIQEYGGLDFRVPAQKYIGGNDQDASGLTFVQLFGYLIDA